MPLPRNFRRPSDRKLNTMPHLRRNSIPRLRGIGVTLFLLRHIPLSCGPFYAHLNWCLLIRRLSILDSSVVRGIPSFPAAPAGPEILSRLSARAASIFSRFLFRRTEPRANRRFGRAASFGLQPAWLQPGLLQPCFVNREGLPSPRITALSTTFLQLTNVAGRGQQNAPPPPLLKRHVFRVRR
jgi:hypothetical protein